VLFLFNRTTIQVFVTYLSGALHILLNKTYRVIRNDCQGFNNVPPRSPDATSCDFFQWGYVKDQVYVPPLPAGIPELKVVTYYKQLGRTRLSC